MDENNKELLDLVSLFMSVSNQNKLDSYTPYPWQKEFHNASSQNVERMLMAANRVGKTRSAAAETAIHLTGLYPDWWEGKRFDRPVLVWTGAMTNEASRDIVQKELLGGVDDENLGTGFVPRRLIDGNLAFRQAGIKNVVEHFRVKHVSGGVSDCYLKTYEQGWKKWQGTAPHVVWMDEEASDYMIFTEAQTRILTSKGILMVTFTPLQGMTDLVQHFMEGGQGIYLKSATWADAPHLDKDEQERLIKSYPSYQVEARTQGIPMLGEGAVFPVSDKDITIDAFKIPDYFARIKGCDFGLDHYGAGCELAWDRDTDIIYLIDCYRQEDKTSLYHAAWFKKTNPQVPVAWPHDGVNREKSGGNTVAGAYRKHGAAMLPMSARYPAQTGNDSEKGGAQPLEPIVEEILERMQTGRFKVFAHLNEFFEEKRSYHRKNGMIVNKRDDILKAVFYAVMMKRYAMPLSKIRNKQQSQNAIVSVA